MMMSDDEDDDDDRFPGFVHLNAKRKAIIINFHKGYHLKFLRDIPPFSFDLQGCSGFPAKVLLGTC